MKRFQLIDSRVPSSRNLFLKLFEFALTGKPNDAISPRKSIVSSCHASPRISQEPPDALRNTRTRSDRVICTLTHLTKFARFFLPSVNLKPHQPSLLYLFPCRRRVKRGSNVVTLNALFCFLRTGIECLCIN